MKIFRCSFPIDVAFNMSTRYSERTTQLETICFSVDFFVELNTKGFSYSSIALLLSILGLHIRILIQCLILFPAVVVAHHKFLQS